MVEGVGLHDHSGDLSANTVLGPALLAGDDAVGLLNRVEDSVAVQGSQGS